MLPRQEFEIVGKVVSVDKAGKRVVVNHEAIPGFMDAMTMPFALRDPFYLDIMEPGDELRAKLVVEDGRSYLDEVAVQRQTTIPGAATTPDTNAPREPEIGATVPGFRLVNEDNKEFSLDEFRGRAVLLTFIYTRCPLPDYCPLMTSNFGDIARLLAGAGVPADKVQLLQISFDPEHDTPAALREYEARNIPDKQRRDRITSATGAPAEVRRIANYFGLLYSQNPNGEIDHSLRTALIAPDGKLVKVYRGNEWKPEEVAADLRRTLGSDTAANARREGG